MTDRITAPYGTWPSPLSASDLAAGAISFADLCADVDAVYWLQADPSDGGRAAVMCHTPDGGTERVSPEGFNARTRVHEYGGGALGVGEGVVLASSWEDQRVHRISGGTATPVTPEPATPAGIRWQGMRVLPGGQAFVAVRETHGPDRPRDNVNVHGHDEAVNEIVRVDLATGETTVLVTGPDFVAGPWPSPDGNRIAWLQWDHPDMPWDTAELWVADMGSDGVAGAVKIAGGDSAVADVAWDGERLWFVDDPSGWWNAYVWQDGEATRVQDETLDMGWPRWIPGNRLTAVDGELWAPAIADGRFHLRAVTPDSGPDRVLEVEGVAEFAALCPSGDGLVAIGGGPALSTAVWRIDPATGTRTALSDVPASPATAVGAVPEAIAYPTTDGDTAHGLYYPPTSATHQAPEGERPPLVVLTHGGPTGAARPGLNMTAQYWTSRGFAVVDVNYRGSFGYGRAYRDRLKGKWGIYDVDDCVAAATHLADTGRADPDRLIIEGGSAGGYTTLLALCTTDVWAAGGSLFGVSDLGALARDTHKFESRYLDGLVGRWPEEEKVYVDRSPITHVDRLATPMIVLQGDEDEVVPPAQAEAIVAALRDRGIPHAYLLFEGEQHGFRRAPNIIRSLEARLAFYGRVLGFAPADDIALPEYVA